MGIQLIPSSKNGWNPTFNTVVALFHLFLCFFPLFSPDDLANNALSCLGCLQSIVLGAPLNLDTKYQIMPQNGVETLTTYNPLKICKG